VGQRISRAKQRIKASGAEFRMPPLVELSLRLAAVPHVLYLIFTEGYTASSGSALLRLELSAEAIRLTRQPHDRLPDDGEVAGLLALMLLTDARRPARTHPDGALVPLAEQDRSRWDATAMAEGVALISRTWPLHRSAGTSCRPRSRRCMTRPVAPRTPIGGGSWGCTSFCSASRRGRW
jgi:predicted RNA polymerase sigma factor